jgi:hypothetical protein
MFASLLHEMMAAFGCASLTLLMFAVLALIVALRLGWFPAVTRLLERLESGSRNAGRSTPESPDADADGIFPIKRN